MNREPLQPAAPPQSEPSETCNFAPEPAEGTVDLPAPTPDGTIDAPSVPLEPLGTVDLPGPVDPGGTVDLPRTFPLPTREEAAPGSPENQVEATGNWVNPASEHDSPLPKDNDLSRQATGDWSADNPSPPVSRAGLVSAAEPMSGGVQFTADFTGERGTKTPGRPQRSTVGGRSAMRTSPGRRGEDEATGPGAEPPSDRYVMKKFHARGGMGEVWLAQDADIGRPVALKRMRKARPEDRDRFLLEAQITGQLEHPGVVPVHELGVDPEGKPYYAMKFIQGRTLKEVIQDFHEGKVKDIPPEVQQLRLLQTFHNICQTMAYAHSRGVIHRDLKPENVMVGAFGETLVLDWGLAKSKGEGDEYSASMSLNMSVSGDLLESIDGSIKGTPGYIAPESAWGKVGEVDERSDVFLLGGILYQTLTGRQPRQGAKVKEMLELARTQAPTPPRQLDKRIPKAINAICVKALSLKKEDRYPSAEALAEDVQRFLAGEPVSAYQETFLEKAGRWVRKHRRLLGQVSLGILLLGLLGFGWWKWQDLEARREADRIEAARLLDETEKGRKEARERATRLQKAKDAQEQIADFERKAEEARYTLASLSPLNEKTPFTDVKKGLSLGKRALAAAAPWGPDLGEMPLTDQRPRLRSEIYDLWLFLVQVRLTQPPEVEPRPTLLSALDGIAHLREKTTRHFHVLRGRILQDMGKDEEAEEEKTKAARGTTPTTAQDHYLLGEEYRTGAAGKAKEGEAKPQPADKDRLTRAVAEYLKAIKLDREHFWSHFQLSVCQLALGKETEAFEALGACIALKPDSPYGYLRRGTGLTTVGRFEEGKIDLDIALEKAPGMRRALLNRGALQMYWGPDRLEGARKDLDAVLEGPEEEKLHEAAFYRAQVHLKSITPKTPPAVAVKKAEAALEDLNLVAEKVPHLRDAFLVRCQVHLFLKKDREARTDLDAYLGFDAPYDPKLTRAQVLRGRLLWALCQDLPPEQRGFGVAAAEAELMEAFKRGARSAPLCDVLGTIAQQQGRMEDAIHYYSEGLKADPKSVGLLSKRGWAYEMLPKPDLEKASADFAAALALDHTHAEAHSGRGYMEACRGNGAEARKQASLAILYGAGDYLILHNVACVFSKLSQTDRDRAEEYVDLTLEHLRREVELWERTRSGHDPRLLIRGDPAFRHLKDHPELQRLLDGK